ncbi:TetR family transcriptional regulator [Saccharothrix carnea]|uniref:TetR family transcriptional regulator n=1 Tax=Saccharothrix carnea TaxID=1280637 RepID=A0A2P8IIF0_SACCR|nr:TetR/AcrR family transcriptional regulator [Saccharothrix carnea]PSL58242.1 TetR family transcriptional regulator [Saccharothrix carnea]
MSTSPRRPYHHGDLRAALVTAARALLVAEGTEGLTLRRAAAAAGVSHTAAYRHFADKAGLVAAVMAQGFDELRAAAGTASGGPRDRLHGIGRAYVGFAVANPSLYRLMFGGEVPRRDVHPELSAAEQRVHVLLSSAVVAAQESGELAAHDEADVTVLLACVLHGLCSLVLAGQLPVERSDALAGAVMALVDAGLAAR